MVSSRVQHPRKFEAPIWSRINSQLGCAIQFLARRVFRELKPSLDIPKLDVVHGDHVFNRRIWLDMVRAAQDVAAIPS